MPNTNVLPNLQGLPLIAQGEYSVSKSYCILDTSSNVGLDSETSNTAAFPCMLQVNPVPPGTVVLVQAKIHPTADWVNIWDSSSSTQLYFIQTYQMPYNFVRVVRFSGSGVVKAFAAAIPTDTMG